MLDLPTGTVSPAGDSRARPLSSDAESDASTDRSSDGKTDQGRRYETVREEVRRRSEAELAAEIDALRQELDAYETRHQEVIDRYERLLREYRRRRDEPSPDQDPTRTERIRLWVLRKAGLR